MTDNINQLTINGQTNTFLGYKNPITFGGIYNFRQGLIDIFTQQFGNNNTRFLSHNLFYFKFPSAFETMPSVAIATNGSGAATGWRFALGTDAASVSGYANSSNGSGLVSVNFSGYTGNWGNSPGNRYMFAVVNNESVAYAHFTSSAMSTIFSWGYIGWAKNGQYTAPVTPRNAVAILADNGSPAASRVSSENSANLTNLTTQNPSLSCAIATPNANATEIILRDSASPNNYIGQAWNLMRMPASCQVGKIYKNTGVDPDTGVVETGRLRFWICLGNWGTETIGMRVYTDNIS